VKLVYGTIGIDFDHNILNDDGRSTVFLTNVDMNNIKKHDNLADPTTDSGATTIDMLMQLLIKEIMKKMSFLLSWMMIYSKTMTLILLN